MEVMDTKLFASDGESGEHMNPEDSKSLEKLMSLVTNEFDNGNCEDQKSNMPNFAFDVDEISLLNELKKVSASPCGLELKPVTLKDLEECSLIIDTVEHFLANPDSSHLKTILECFKFRVERLTKHLKKIYFVTKAKNIEEGTVNFNDDDSSNKNDEFDQNTKERIYKILARLTPCDVSCNCPLSALRMDDEIIRVTKSYTFFIFNRTNQFLENERLKRQIVDEAENNEEEETEESSEEGQE